MKKPAPHRWSVGDPRAHGRGRGFYLPECHRQDYESSCGALQTAILQKPIAMIPDRSHFSKESRQDIEYLPSTPSLHSVLSTVRWGSRWIGGKCLLFIGARSRLHTKHMLDVKADPNFPKTQPSKRCARALGNLQ
jgi:hypothetical protein